MKTKKLRFRKLDGKGLDEHDEILVFLTIALIFLSWIPIVILYGYVLFIRFIPCVPYYKYYNVKEISRRSYKRK